MTTPSDVLDACRAAGVRLTRRGDRIEVAAPAGACTAELRAALAQHKPELLARLVPADRYVTLKPDARTGQAVTLPIEPILLALDLERRGYRQSLDAAQQYQIAPAAGLSDEDRAAIRRWRRHLAAIIGYTAPVCA